MPLSQTLKCAGHARTAASSPSAGLAPCEVGAAWSFMGLTPRESVGMADTKASRPKAVVEAQQAEQAMHRIPAGLEPFGFEHGLTRRPDGGNQEGQRDQKEGAAPAEDDPVELAVITPVDL